VLLSGDETGFGLGWTIEDFPLDGEPTPLASSASRTLLGGSTSLLIFPEHRITVAMLSNISHADLRSLAVQVARAFVEGDAAVPTEPALPR
jgi:CubicO group peptidase (beta-lactamase class C family)